MALIKNKLSSIENEVIKSANEQIELKQKDHFKHFQRLNRTMIECINHQKSSNDAVKSELSKHSELIKAINDASRSRLGKIEAKVNIMIFLMLIYFVAQAYSFYVNY